ncbi:Transglutaminase-like superfamily protein [Fibrobacter sp. UWT3]|uniref:transglutaminase-like domain-containing protein n=1 Tax=Fibrobacter sp. UWT3 TaxID=1896225 RepID=UPI000BC92FF1|nr:transglutaminase-like domain-containing protein [Fibrobacter sp. UWT3]SOE78401.1 Transglutaminase-like superfamily protein [Fibrobacter sp. UWT3]
MRRFSLREKAKTFLLCAASLNLGLSSDLSWLGIIFVAAFIVLLFRYDASHVPVYRKSIAYGLIVPFAIWWVLSPEMEYGMSPWLVFIPAYYLLSLAYLQKRSLGNGGYDVFVLFNGVAVLLLSCFQASRYGVLLNVFALLLLLHAYARPGVKWWKHALFLLLFLGLSAISFGGLKYWQSHGHNRAERMADYYAKRHLMGFDPVVKLGSFESNFAGKYNREVVLRVWDTLAPTYMRAAVYEKYVGGIWKLPAHRDRMLYSARYKVDYAVFETRDSVSSADSTYPVWVQSTLDNFGFIFAPYNAVAVAVKNADSVEYFKSNVFKQGETRRGDWFYYMPLPSGPTGPYVMGTYASDTPDSSYLQVFAPLAGFLDTVAMEIGLDTIPDKPAIMRASRYSRAISDYFLRHFAYSLRVDESKVADKLGAKPDPLRVFWATRSGYCEYYATLSVLLLRRAGIKARYVTGFARPEIEPGRPYAIFRRNSSHAWVEMRSMGFWTTFDPTPPLFVVKVERPSWFAMKLESLRARSARIFHVLRDGEWRLALNSWQDAVQNIFSGTALYVVLGCIALAVVLFRFVRALRRRRSNAVLAQSVQHWVKGLEAAEKSLARIGLVREPGETVGAFLARCESEMPAGEKDSRVSRRMQARLQSAIQFLREYEEQRWRI